VVKCLVYAVKHDVLVCCNDQLFPAVIAFVNVSIRIVGLRHVLESMCRILFIATSNL
jgi:hypothetical protein